MEASAVVVPGRASARAHAALIGIVFAMASHSAFACPACATRGGGGLMLPLLLGAMILTPYLVATVVLRIIRNVETQGNHDDTNATADLPSQDARASGTPLKA
jgi:hypothetical protein